jgi:tetratricopeptide (TPR) repeat protein
LWKRGQLHAAQGDWESALADYTAAIQVDPSWPWVYYLRALALAELGQTDEAQADLARALELDPVGELRQQIESLVLDK